jgi:hypothetical protein
MYSENTSCQELSHASRFRGTRAGFHLAPALASRALRNWVPQLPAGNVPCNSIEADGDYSYCSSKIWFGMHQHGNEGRREGALEVGRASGE